MGITSSTPDYGRAWTQKRRCGGSVDIFVQSESGVDPYFRFLKNNADGPLPVFMGCRPVPQLKWGYGVAQQYVCRLQPLVRHRPIVAMRWVDGRGPPADLRQPPRPTT
jgi:hypothetical protein